MTDRAALFDSLQALHFAIHDRVRRQLRWESREALSRAAKEGCGDISYAVDLSAEELIHQHFLRQPPPGGAVVISEGPGQRVYPQGLSPGEARYRILIDPLDGTREIMVDKRSCWILTGVAENRGPGTTLRDLFLCLQTEVPPSFQDRSAVLWAEKGGCARLRFWDVERRLPLGPEQSPRPSGAEDLRHGFAVFVNLFPGMKEELSRLEEAVLRDHLGPPEPNAALVFPDQYISTGGQVYLLATGRYRLVADLRAEAAAILRPRGRGHGLCCHPYDLSTWLILQEAGACVTDGAGGPLAYPLDTDTDCAFIAYANPALKAALEPLIARALEGLRGEAAVP